MEIKKSEFKISSAKISQCPKDNLMEFAFIGRSNVGKSSLINMLCNHKNLAKTSATPGKTLLINHFLIESKPSPPPNLPTPTNGTSSTFRDMVLPSVQRRCRMTSRQ